MFNDLFEYFSEEIYFKNSKKELDEKNKMRNRFMYFLTLLFIILFICSFFNII